MRTKFLIILQYLPVLCAMTIAIAGGSLMTITWGYMGSDYLLYIWNGIPLRFYVLDEHLDSHRPGIQWFVGVLDILFWFFLAFWVGRLTSHIRLQRFFPSLKIPQKYGFSLNPQDGLRRHPESGSGYILKISIWLIEKVPISFTILFGIAGGMSLIVLENLWYFWLPQTAIRGHTIICTTPPIPHPMLFFVILVWIFAPILIFFLAMGLATLLAWILRPLHYRLLAIQAGNAKKHSI